MFDLKTLLVLAAASGLWAQTLTGRVVDPVLMPLASVKLSLVKNKIDAVTDTNGRFVLDLGATSNLHFFGVPGTDFTIIGNSLEQRFDGEQQIRFSLYSAAGGKKIIKSFLVDGKIMPGPRARPAAQAPGFAKAGAALFPDTLMVSQTGYVTKKMPLGSFANKDLGDIILGRFNIAVNNPTFDEFDDFLLEAVAKAGMDQHVALIIKAMLKAESYFNPLCISFYDQQLPCGTHSYGIIQLTPGCVPGFAALPADTRVTATITGGVRSTKAVITYNDSADKASGNTIVKENGIIVDLVTNPSNPFWATSAFNPEYNIVNGARIFKKVLTSMKANFAGCTEANYVAMALAGYNEGDQAVKSCTNYGTSYGSQYAKNVTADYRSFCKTIGIAPIY